MKAKIFICLLLLFAVFIWTVEALVFSWSPRYTAQAEFTVNWGLMWLADNDSNSQKMRQKFDNSLTKFKVSNQFISLLGENCNLPPAESDTMAKNLHRYVSIARIGETNGCDLYRIQFSDNNRQVALKAVNLLSRRLVEKINLKAKIQNAQQTISSYQENASVRENDEEARQELASLFQQQQKEYSNERQAQIQAIEDQSNQNDFQKFITGIKMIGHLGGFFSNPAEIVESGVVVKN